MNATPVSSFPAAITPVVLAFNEEANMDRTLGQLKWADRVIVMDSFSTDQTLAICARFPNVEVVQRTFDNPWNQLNHGIDLARTEWVMVLGADYVLTDELVAELAMLHSSADTHAYIGHFHYCINGRPLRGSLYPPRELVFRRACGRYAKDGHTESLVWKGNAQHLHHRVHHDDRKPLSRWLASQDRYAKLEAEKLAATPRAALGFNDRIRATILLGPPVVFLYTLFLRGVILDGWAGWYYALQRALAEMLLSLRLIEAKWMTAESKVQSPKSKVIAD